MEELLRNRERLLRQELYVSLAATGLLLAGLLVLTPSLIKTSVYTEFKTRRMPHVHYIDNAKQDIKPQGSDVIIEQI